MPEEPPEGTVPSENRLGADDGDGSEEHGEHLGDGSDGQPITGLESRVRGGSLQDDDLRSKAFSARRAVRERSSPTSARSKSVAFSRIIAAEYQ